MPKEQFALISSAIHGGAYDKETQELDLAFSSGRTYTLHNVPASLVEELKDADSPGAFFRERMKGRF